MYENLNGPFSLWDCYGFTFNSWVQSDDLSQVAVNDLGFIFIGECFTDLHWKLPAIWRLNWLWLWSCPQLNWKRWLKCRFFPPFISHSGCPYKSCSHLQFWCDVHPTRVGDWGRVDSVGQEYFDVICCWCILCIFYQHRLLYRKREKKEGESGGEQRVWPVSHATCICVYLFYLFWHF